MKSEIFGSSQEIVESGTGKCTKQGEKTNERKEIIIISITVTDALSNHDFVVKDFELADAG